MTDKMMSPDEVRASIAKIVEIDSEKVVGKCLSEIDCYIRMKQKFLPREMNVRLCWPSCRASYPITRNEEALVLAKQKMIRLLVDKGWSTATVTFTNRWWTMPTMKIQFWQERKQSYGI